MAKLTLVRFFLEQMKRVNTGMKLSEGSRNLKTGNKGEEAKLRWFGHAWKRSNIHKDKRMKLPTGNKERHQKDINGCHDKRYVIYM